MEEVSGKNYGLLSTMFALVDPSVADEGVPTTNARVDDKASYLLKQIHGGRNLHYGARRTWRLLNQLFPGHKIPYRKVEDFVLNCPICQKDRIGMTDYLLPAIKHLKPPHWRSRIGVDQVTITPKDKNGNCVCVVIVDHFTKHTGIYPFPEYTAETVATALFQYFCAYGVFDEIISDPGSAIMADVVTQLNAWLGVKHKVSLVDRHESNGVEGTNKKILGHLRTLVHDERILNRWSDPTVLPLINFALNDAINHETGIRPFDAKFGMDDSKYMKLPDGVEPDIVNNEWVLALTENLRVVRDISKKYHHRSQAHTKSYINEGTMSHVGISSTK